MRVSVDTSVGHGDVVMPRRFRLGGREIDVADNLDQWPGSGYCYFKLRGGDGNLYILRLDQGSGEWELTMFERARSQAVTPHLHSYEGSIESVSV